MALLPGRRFEMSSHFIPLPRSSMIKASSSGDHLLCFLAGDSATCGGMARLPLTARPGATGGGPYGGSPLTGAVAAVVAVADGSDEDRVC